MIERFDHRADTRERDTPQHETPQDVTPPARQAAA
jgi:hypothetical protein